MHPAGREQVEDEEALHVVDRDRPVALHENPVLVCEPAARGHIEPSGNAESVNQPSTAGTANDARTLDLVRTSCAYASRIHRQ